MSTSITDQPTPEHLTLLLKHGRSTTVLFALPSQSLSEVKSMLLTALASRDITTFPNTDTELPSSTDDLDFAVLVDRREPAKGWVNVNYRATVVDAKGNKKKGAASSKAGRPANTVGDLDVKDGAWIAYRLKVAGIEVEEGVEGEELSMKDDPGWNVVVPSYDDEDAADEGVDAMEDDIPIPIPANAVAR